MHSILKNTCKYILNLNHIKKQFHQIICLRYKKAIVILTLLFLHFVQK